MVSTNGIKFFSPDDYKHLKYKHLPLARYKELIREINKIRVEQILDKKEGSILPLGFGTIKVLKRFRLKPVSTIYGIFRNEHSLGYLFSINFIQSLKKVSYKSFYTTKNSVDLNRKNDSPRFGLFKFWGNRTTLKPKLIEHIHNNTRDYDKIN